MALALNMKRKKEYDIIQKNIREGESISDCIARIKREIIKDLEEGKYKGRGD